MSLNWLDPMREEEETELTEKMVDQVLKRGLDLPAVLFVEAHKPFGNIGSHAVMSLVSEAGSACASACRSANTWFVVTSSKR